jgi:hypothetical protein
MSRPSQPPPHVPEVTTLLGLKLSSLMAKF